MRLQIPVAVAEVERAVRPPVPRHVMSPTYSVSPPSASFWRAAQASAAFCTLPICESRNPLRRTSPVLNMLVKSPLEPFVGLRGFQRVAAPPQMPRIPTRCESTPILQQDVGGPANIFDAAGRLIRVAARLAGPDRRRRTSDR